jgi:ATP-binding cassette subfamily C protein CydC
MISQKRQSDFIVFMRLLNLFKPYFGWMALGILLSLITALSNVGLLALSGWFISIMAIAGVAGITEINYFTPSASIRGLAITRTAGRYFERVVSHEATFRLLAELRQWFYNKLETLAPAVLQRYQSGDILSRISADINTLENFYIRIISPIIVAIIALIFYAFFLARYDNHLLIAEITLLIIAGLIVPIIINRLAKKSAERINQTSSELRSSAIDSVQGMGELLIYGAVDKQINKTKTLSDALMKDQQTQAKLSGFSQGIIGLCSNIAMWVILVISIPLMGNGTLEFAHLAMLALFALASFEVILPLPLAFQLLPLTLAASRRLFEIVDSSPAISEPKNDSPKLKNYDIVFNNVCFSYDSNSKNEALSNLSFTLKSGEKLALVGPSGIGKSSVVQLLSRFWQIENQDKNKDKGTITFGSHPIEDFHSDDIRQYFSVLSQQNILFNNTIKNNLLLANPSATKEQLDEVCKIVKIDAFISSTPDGYDTWVGEAGFQLSGGQARRIAMARALLKDAPILILDEPGEGLDVETEKEVLESVFEYKKAASILLITHKKAGLNLVDKIIKMV